LIQEADMAKVKRSPARERRIEMEIVVDAYDAEERAMGWFGYLADTLAVPFTATCIAERAISPLRKGEKVEVVEMGPGEECGREMFVWVRWEGRRLAVPLAQLKPAAKAGKGTTEAIADWHYWVAQGYEF
jgi:hypothetical protein